MQSDENLDHSRAEINRRNAEHSTGPVTEEGKSRSRFNAFLGGHPKPAIRGHLKTGQRDS